MVEPKRSRKKATEVSQEITPQTDTEIEADEAERQTILATGLEDYGRWKAMYKDYQRDPNEKPFRRGRIWC